MANCIANMYMASIYTFAIEIIFNYISVYIFYTHTHTHIHLQSKITFPTSVCLNTALWQNPC